MESSTLNFAEAARSIGSATRARGLVVPGFRSPPKVPEADRTLRRRPDGATVAVVVKGRPFQAVIADMIEGVVVTNHLQGAAATRVRTYLWEAVVGSSGREAA